MSRVLLKNSTPTTTMASNTVRRWKSSFLHLKQQRQRETLSSQGETSNVCGVSVASSSLSSTSRLLTSSSFACVINTRSQHTLPVTKVSTSPVQIQSKRKMSSGDCGKCLKLDSINPNFINMDYAVRGPLVIRAAEIEKELAAGKKKSFDQVIRANIGDCHAMGQKPITHLRQMLALCYYAPLFDSPDIPNDVKERANAFLDGCHGRSAGSYTDSTGTEVVRRQVAAFIEERDCHPCDYNNIALSGGASPAIKSILQLLNVPVDCKPPGILTPIPQYPLYSATLSEYGMGRIGYYLNEKTNWGLDIKELERTIEESREKYTPRAIVIINPGNPTGQVLTRENIEEIIKFAHKHKLVLLADEVYQHNVYAKGSKFFSFKKTLMDLGEPYSQHELVSFNSASKGYLGECGIRGGYMELLNIDPEVQAMLYKALTASLCSTTAGQIAVSALVNPPKECDESYELFVKERDEVLNQLAIRAKLVHKAFNTFEGFSCCVVQGAMYAFPQIKIPPKAIEAAKKKNQPPDVFYAFELLETSGICVVPGSGFDQEPGTYHFRTTILPQTDKLKIMLEKFQKFHAQFMEKYK